MCEKFTYKNYSFRKQKKCFRRLISKANNIIFLWYVSEY